jgi:hypothetical protein
MRTNRPALFASLSRRDWLGVAALAVVAVAFGLVVEVRSALLKERRTDLPVYLEAAWAVRAGTDPYDIKTERSCHYNYPPLLAIALAPLAQRPLGAANSGSVPFPLAVLLWYILSLAALFWGADRLARALEKSASDPAVRNQRRGCRRWWLLRLLPILVCLPGVARTLSLGQVDLLVLALICATAAAAVRRRGWEAGLWLSIAVCIKLIPAFLLLYPLRRRDWPWLASCTAGVLVCGALVPIVVWGPVRAWEYQRHWVEAVVLPGFGLGNDHSRESDLTSLAAVNSQSFVGVLHNFQYPDRQSQPARASFGVMAVAALACTMLTALTLLPAGRRGLRSVAYAVNKRTRVAVARVRWHRPDDAHLIQAEIPSETVVVRQTDRSHDPALALGGLVAVMLLLVPVCHPHYLCHWMPLVMILLALDMERHCNRGVGRRLLAVFAVLAIANGLASIPGLTVLRDFGLAAACGMFLWSLGTVALWRRATVLPDGSEQPVILPFPASRHDTADLPRAIRRS